MKVLVTGATGFVGLNNVSALVEQGHDVHLYVRPSSSRKYIANLDATIHEGELDDLERVASAMRGTDAVIHTAGSTSCFARDYASLHKTNFIGTKTVVDAALASDVSRLVYTSTTSTIGRSDGDGAVDDENTPLTGFRAKSPYGQTKLLAENEVMRAHKEGVTAIILNPAEIVGEYDHNFQWGRLVMAVFANQVPFLPPGGGSFCSARAVANAHVAALSKGESGQRYILAGDDREYVSMLDIIAKLLDTNFDRPTTNYRWLYMKEWTREKLYPLLGKDFLVEPYRMKVFAGRYFYSDQKAQQALNYKSPKLEEMLAQCVSWYKENDILPA